VVLVRRLEEVPPLLAPYVRVVGWVVEEEPTPPLPSVPIVQVPRLPPILPSEPLTIIDGNAGIVYIEPSVQTLNRYQAQLLRVASHTRFHLEPEHQSVRTWDGHPMPVGAWVSGWAMVPQAVQAGADFVAVRSPYPPEDVTTLGQVLGGKPLWWITEVDSLVDEAIQAALWKWSASVRLTCLLEQPSNEASLQLEAWWQAMEQTRETLRRDYQPLGQLEIGLAVRWNQPRAKPPADARFPVVHTLCWFEIDLSRRRTVEALLAQQRWAVQNGKRRALVLNDVESLQLAIALGMQPHALLTTPEAVQLLKRWVALLGIDECRHWLMQRLHAWNDPDLLAQPDRWLAMRTG